MKSMALLFSLMLSTQLFAATPYSFACTKGSDGSCNITNQNAHVMKTTQAGLYQGTEGQYNLFYLVDTDGTLMAIYKGNTELAQAMDSKYLAVPTANGYTGVILVEDTKNINAAIK